MKNLLLLFWALTFTVIITAQNNYYVATTGSDDNDGSLDYPWETIEYGIDQLLAGNTLNIMSGTYNEKLYVNVSGSNSNFITIRNYNSDEVIIDGSNIPDATPVIEIEDQSFLIIEGLVITNNEMEDAQGILINNN